MLGVFAGAAALAFAGAYVGPAAFALSETPDASDESTTVYASTMDDAQSLLTAESSVVVAELNRGGYTAYETPKPTPTPTATESESSGSPAASLPYYTGGGAPAEWMAAAGISEADMAYVDYIVGRESGWNPNATNSSSGACGLVQAYPCSKVPGNGYDPVDNLRWGNGYAIGRYGSWAAAFDFWSRNHWW